MRLLAPFGFYGSGNIGDEATLRGFATLLSESQWDARVTIGSRNPEHTARVEPAFRYFRVRGRDWRRTWAAWRASAHAVVGGTPIMDLLGRWPLSELTPLVREAGRRRLPLAFVGIGTEDLRSAESRQTVAAEIAPRVCHWSVRSVEDRRRLTEYGVAERDITVAADMAWLLRPVTTEFGRAHLSRCGVNGAPLIGVNLVNEKSMLDRNPGLVESLATALDTIAEKLGAQIVFLSNEVREEPEFDRAAAMTVSRKMRRSERVVIAPAAYLSPDQMMSVIACCALTVSMRYHFCLFSALQSIPFVALARSGKITDLCADLGWQARFVPPEIDGGELAATALHLADHANEARELLSQRVPQMRERATRNIAALEALVSPAAGGRPGAIV